MQIGAVFPQTEIGSDPAGIRAYAQAVQDLGLTHLLVYDHVLGADRATYPDLTGPYRTEHQFHEPFVLFGYLAAVAPALELVTNVIILPQRQTVLVAKQAAEVDILTNGRSRLGVGIGWNYVEYDALGMSFKDRGRRFDEQIELLRALWGATTIDFEGKYHRVRAAGINPLPVQRPIPIWIGASAEVALKRAATVADGFFPQRPLEGGWAATLDRLREWRREAGLDVAGFGIEPRINVESGDPDQWRREAEEWQALGATHLGLVTMRGGLGGPDGHVQRLREVTEALRGL